MTRGTVQETKIHYRGQNVHDDFIVYTTNVELLQKWKTDKSIPLVDVLDAYQIFVTHKQGAQGILDTASHAELDSEFGTHKIEDVAERILKEGSVVKNKGSSKEADKNPTNGPGISSRGNVHQ
ncbi:FYSH [Glarea lozoyensis ATCC 20868]|uniref:FYSH n=1 Tax=Glarea lozoyensis (strain ATCC 20868 / MF5171) TaxID=1116229 RepID=S3DB28_GLAL2|nr:FYSH [Glarea lozoyensis ATCC 20868]EPE34945.1 FYSH [Glarea lozoyensis ATCC 20868]